MKALGKLKGNDQATILCLKSIARGAPLSVLKTTVKSTNNNKGYALNSSSSLREVYNYEVNSSVRLLRALDDLRKLLPDEYSRRVDIVNQISRELIKELGVLNKNLRDAKGPCPSCGQAIKAHLDPKLGRYVFESA